MEILLQQQAPIVKRLVPDKKWLVIYTRPRWEKKVDQTMREHGIESYCPVRLEQRQWADRKKMVEMPLFVSYLFVKVDAHEQASALYSSGVINYVHFMGKPAIVRDHLIEKLKANLAAYKDIEVIGMQDLGIGDRVKIREGLLTNQIGTVVKLQGRTVLMLLDEINCAIVTRIDKGNLINQKTKQTNEI